ncbi:MAG TPA: CRISPR-associated protein, partial [Firmicutes bacterium]|nr:CRISPR-associated protein [Bacillota bacterium]
FKRKVRDLIDDKDGPVWAHIRDRFSLSDDEYRILESRGRVRKDIERELAEGTFTRKYWDGRLFGNTFLEEGASTFIKTGAVQFGLGVSIAPVDIRRITTTNKAGVQEEKDRGMAPMGYRVVQHGVYCMPFFVNPTAAVKSGCTKQDIDVMLAAIPYAYTHTASYIRSFVEIRKAWYMEHTSPLGSCSDFVLIDALTPRKCSNLEAPSLSWQDYEVPSSLPQELLDRLASCRDLMAGSSQVK